MDRADCCILVNSTPAYFYILPLFFKLLRRYAPKLRWDVLLATEAPNHSICKQVVRDYAVKCIPIPEESSGFLESRMVALLSVAHDYNYCLPLQEDFLLEMPMWPDAFENIMKYMDSNMCVVSARVMPCPGPSEKSVVANSLRAPDWKLITKETDPFGFTFQATLWKMKPLIQWYTRICAKLETICRKDSTDPSTRKRVELKENLAENAIGQTEFWTWTDEKDYEHIAFERAGPWPNAVYLSPFPYRPTAIVRGKLEAWALELAKREGVTLVV
jgi:hypothetical protein